jgi:hypothetical protein
MRKVMLLSLVLIVTLASCGPVTAIPPATPTATGRLNVTNTPVVLSTAEPVYAGPSGDVSSYRLQAWDEESFRKEFVPIGSENNEVALFKEFLFRFPESKFRYEMLGDILTNMPKTADVPGLQHQKDLMSSMIVGILESGVQLSGLQSELEKSDLHVVEPLSMKNLMGNGEDDFILRISTCKLECQMGIWVAFRDGEKYRVEKIRDWDYADWPRIAYELVDVGDTNGNEISELIVLRSEKSGGSMYVALEDFLDHFEWSPANGIFQRTKFPLISQQCMLLGEIGAKPKTGIGSCSYDWKFTNNGPQSRLITQNYWYTQVGCPDLTVQHISAWDGRQYVLRKAEILPLDGNLSSECRLAWADTAISLAEWEDDDLTQPGWENDPAISIIEQTLAIGLRRPMNGGGPPAAIISDLNWVFGVNFGVKKIKPHPCWSKWRTIPMTHNLILLPEWQYYIYGNEQTKEV